MNASTTFAQLVDGGREMKKWPAPGSNCNSGAGDRVSTQARTACGGHHLIGVALHDEPRTGRLAPHPSARVS